MRRSQLEEDLKEECCTPREEEVPRPRVGIPNSRNSSEAGAQRVRVEWWMTWGEVGKGWIMQRLVGHS